MKVAIQCSSWGQRCGISVYSRRLRDHLNRLPDVEAFVFVEEPTQDYDIISIQYEPGIMPPERLRYFLSRFSNVPVVITAHHNRYIEAFQAIVDGIVFHDESQLPSDLWQGCYRIIPHPAIVFPKKDKRQLRKKYGLPEDKIIIGTAGFITGTGKKLPVIIAEILKRMDDSMFLYCITSFWKGGDFGRYTQMMNVARLLNKAHQIRIDTDFVLDEILNEKMQACDLLFAWNITGPNDKGSQSGIAADMYGSYTKLIVKDSPHYSFIKKQEGVLVGRPNAEDFAEDVIRAVKEEDLNDVPDPKWLSWEEKVKDYKDYFEEVMD